MFSDHLNTCVIMAVGGPLFGSSSGGRAPAKSSLVEFRCGKMTFNETTKMVSVRRFAIFFILDYGRKGRARGNGKSMY